MLDKRHRDGGFHEPVLLRSLRIRSIGEPRSQLRDGQREQRKRAFPPKLSGNKKNGRLRGLSGLTDMPPRPGATNPSASGLMSTGTRAPSMLSPSPQTGRPTPSTIITRYKVVG